MLITECLGNDKGIPELCSAIRHFVKTVTKWALATLEEEWVLCIKDSDLQ